eukprot:2629141-Rhodomonas_salina.3
MGQAGADVLNGLAVVLFIALVFAIAGVQLLSGQLRNRCFHMDSGAILPGKLCQGLEGAYVESLSLCPERYDCLRLAKGSVYPPTLRLQLCSAPVGDAGLRTEWSGCESVRSDAACFGTTCVACHLILCSGVASWHGEIGRVRVRLNRDVGGTQASERSDPLRSHRRGGARHGADPDARGLDADYVRVLTGANGLVHS